VKSALKKQLLALPGFQAFCRRLTRRHVRALMYHRFVGAVAGREGYPDRETLAWQMDRIAEHHALWTVARHHQVVVGARPVDEDCPVVVTVDDGYRDVYEVAFPVFRDRRIPATIYVTTGFLDGTVWFWWDQLSHLFAVAPAGVTEIEHAGEAFRLDLSSGAARQETWNSVADRCRFLPDDRKRALIVALTAHLGVSIPVRPPAPHDAVTWPEVREMRRAGIEFGSHTVTHPILTRVSPAEAREEIVASKRRLEEVLGEPVAWFCYPQGGPADYSPDLAAAVAAAGYAGSYLAYQEVMQEPTAMTMPRYSLGADRVDFLWILCGAEYLGLRVKRLLRRPTGPDEHYWNGSEVSHE
jgi:peptidoglycan/xylan/chitin deacetylase (PgdA/CDA1 family)